jgi:hypothetical protein
MSDTPCRDHPACAEQRRPRTAGRRLRGERANAVLEAEGEWNERSEGFAPPRLACRGCNHDMKALNRRTPGETDGVG